MDRLDMRCCVSLFTVDCSTSQGAGLFTLVSTQRTTQSPTFWLIENCWAAVAAAAAAAGSAERAAAGGGGGGGRACGSLGSGGDTPGGIGRPARCSQQSKTTTLRARPQN